MKMNNKFLAALLAAIALIGLSGCEEGAGERAGKAVDEAVEDAGEAIEDAQESVEDAIEENEDKDGQQ